MAEFNPDAYLSESGDNSAFDPDSYLGTALQQNEGVPDWMPTDANLAVQQPVKPERSFGDIAEGLGEAALTIGTGATTGALGFLGGSIEAAIGKLTGGLTEDEAVKLIQDRSGGMTNMPESEAGQEYVKAIGDTLGVLPPVLGMSTMFRPKGLRGQARVIFDKMESPLAKKIATEASGNALKTFDKTGRENFKPRVWGMVKKARDQGFDEGMTTVIANASPMNKRKMRQMVGSLERGKVDAEFQAVNRPADIAGDSLLKQVNFIKGNNKQAGIQLGRIADTLEGKPVDVAEPITRFVDDLAEMGVKLDDELTPSFEGSVIEFSGPAKTLVENTLTKIKRNPTPDALDAHKFKKFLDEDLRFGKKKEGGVSGKVERVMGDLRKGVNESISSEYKGYREANARFSDTIKSMDLLQDAAGKKIDFFGPNADKAMGTVLRSLMNNTKGRANLMNAVDNIEATSKKYGGSFDDNILTQMLFADELDAVFGGGGRTSFRGETKKGNVDAAVDISQMTIPGAIGLGVKSGAKALRGINEKNQLKAIKALLKEK